MSKSLKRIPVAAWLGVALLVFSFACVIWVNGMGVHAAEDNNSTSSKADEAKVLCYAYGDVEPGASKLYTTQPNQVVKIVAQENDLVEKDAPLIQLDNTLAKNQLARAKVALEKAENDLENAKLLPEEHEAQIAGQKAVIAAKESELKATQKKYDELKHINDNKLGGVSKEDVAVAAAVVEAHKDAVKVEEAKLRVLEIATPRVERGRRDAEIQVEEKKILVRDAKYALGHCTIKAPEKGTVLRIMVAEGDVLSTSPREPAVIFCPANKPRILRGEVEQEFAYALKVGQKVTARDDSMNSPKLEGKVTRISGWYSHRRSLVQEPFFNDVRTVECIITLDPTDPPQNLLIGQRFRVTLFDTKK